MDSAPLRKKARQEYEKVLRGIDRAKVDLERFREKDRPLYDRWLNSHFGASLTRNRELQSRLFAAQGLVQEVQQEAFFGGHRSMHQAYRRVMHRREHPEEVEEEQREAEEAEAKFRKDFEEVFGFSEEEIFERLGGFRGGPGLGAVEDFPGGKEPPEDARLKDLYRALARRLHPDMAEKRSAKELEWWHQTQAAYEAGDVEQLQLILTLAEIEEKGSSQASVGILQRITAQFKAGLNALRRELRQCRRDAAWGFSVLSDFEEVGRRTQAWLDEERDRLTMQLAAFELEIADWRARAESAARKARRQPRRAEPSPWF